jgi:hypothetical protein
MERVPAASGWLWIKQGFALFRRQPAEMATLFVLYCCFNLLMYLIPPVGVISYFVLIPIFSMAFMTACGDIEQDKRVHPRVLFAGFKNPALKRLLGLGSCYLLAIVVAIIVANLSDDGYLFEAITKQVENPPTSDAAVPQDLRLMKSFAVLMCFYLFAILPLWFAAPLLAWQNMSLGKAMFFSFFSVIRAIKAIALFAVCWLLINLAVNFGIDALLQLLRVDNMEIGALIQMPFLLVLVIVMHCAYYLSYKQIFGPAPLAEES